MSDTAQGAGWWQASDGKWYPPDSQPGWGQPPSTAGSTTWSGPPGAPSSGWASSPATQAPSTNGLATASLILGIIGIPGVFVLVNVFSVLALVFGIIARSQIQKSGGTQGGAGMAMAGIVLGIVGLAFVALWIALVAALGVYNS